MSVEFRTVSFSHQQGPEQRKPEPMTKATDSFCRQPISADACIKSWKLYYIGKNRPVRDCHCRIKKVQIEDEKVVVTVDFGLTDNAGETDNNAWGCDMEVLVIGELPNN